MCFSEMVRHRQRFLQVIMDERGETIVIVVYTRALAPARGGELDRRCFSLWQLLR